MKRDYLLFVGILVIGLVAGYFLHAGTTEKSLNENSLAPTAASNLTYFQSPTAQGYTNLNHHSISTKMSLQGKVTDFNNNVIDDGNLEVKISDINSCTANVFFDYNYPNLIQDGLFNVLLGDQNDLLRLNFNQDYYMCLNVNGQQLSGPQTFRGGQGEVHSAELYDGNASVPLDVNYLKVRNDVNVVGNILVGCGKIYWDDVNHAINIQVNC